MMFCFLDFDCQYQCSQLPGKTRFRNDLLCVKYRGQLNCVFVFGTETAIF